MAKHFNVERETISDVFIEPKHFFEIPRFQRPYSWEEGNIEEFWETIFTSDPVFLGTIIFNNRRKDEENIVEIIDGQQRYLTIQILGAVIRDICQRLLAEFSDPDFEHIARGVTASLLGKPDKWNPQKHDYYLTPGESIKSFFIEYVQKYENDCRIDSSLVVKKSSEEERVKDAYLRFTSLLEDVLDGQDLEGKKDLLKDLLDKKLGKHFFARIEIEDEDLAYEIFETVNAKGVDLNVADLIKNQIFRHVVNGDKKYIDGAKERWLTLTETVDASGLTMKDFLSYYWSSKYGYVADRKLYKTIRDHFRDNKRWDEFLDDLVENAFHVKNIFTGTLEDLEKQTGDITEASKIFDSLRVLRNTKAKTWSILYLCLFRNLFINENTGNRKSSFELGNRWDILAKFTFVYYEVLNLSGNWYFKEIWNFCKKIEEYVAAKKNNKDFADLFRKELFSQFDTKLPKTRDIFEDGFATISYKDSKKGRVIIRYILNEFELKLDGKFGVGFDESKVSIEHILPQDPKEWGRTKKEVKDYVNQLGNLLLISKRKNGSLGNKPLADKLVELRDQASKLRLVDEFLTKAESKEWDFSSISTDGDFISILSRSRYMAELGYSIWVQELRQRMGFS